MDVVNEKLKGIIKTFNTTNRSSAKKKTKSELINPEEWKDKITELEKKFDSINNLKKGIAIIHIYNSQKM